MVETKGDPAVFAVQTWVNLKYGKVAGFQPAPLNGKTGWSTVYALTRALQIELGITSLADAFGPTTASKYKQWGEMTLGKVPTDAKGKAIVQILKGAMYCKGYNPGKFDDVFDEKTKNAVVSLQKDAGLPITDGTVYDYIFKAFLTMDAYRLTPGGDAKVRQIQQDLNNKYYKTSDVQPTDGHYQRGTNKALVYGLQTEMGIAAGSQTGSIGPATKNGLPILKVGSSGRFVTLFQYALYFNGHDSGSFSTTYNANVESTVKKFQGFTLLPVDGVANKSTWLSALVSTGDPDRKGKACDCITEVTLERGKALKTAGYETVGRYLVNVPGGINKKIQPGELKNIFDAGLSVFPIYQANGREASSFSATQGRVDAEAAFKAAKEYGFKNDTTIYFAVDFDAYGIDITDNILPHFKALNEKMLELGGSYKVGVYGARNVCIQVSEKGYAKTSFVSGMSTGFSGNLGYPLPKNWAFDQISTIKVGSGSGAIEIDNNIKSGRDNGVSVVSPPVQLKHKDDVYLPNESVSSFKKDLVKAAKEQLAFLTGLKALRKPEEAIDIIVKHDKLLTNLSQTYSMRKAMIQSVLFRELICYGVDDPIADGLVQIYFAFKEDYEKWDKLPSSVKAVTPPPIAPPVMKEDSSTGLGQIFAATAIDSINYAVTIKLISEKIYKTSNWKDMKYIWFNLKDNEEFNLKTCALVLVRAANQVDLKNNYYDYDVNQIKKVLARYNGKGDKAVEYGNTVYKLYLA
ncbi:glycoside hydrolase domain-containing protein, partial [Bacillus sp. GKis3/1]